MSSPEQTQAPYSVARLHSRDTSCLPERHSCDAQAERLQQYQDRIAQESEAVLVRAETQRAQSNLELLVSSLGEEQAEQSMEARYAAGTRPNNIACGGGLCGQLVHYAVHVSLVPIRWGSFTEFSHLPEINPRVSTLFVLIACAPRYQLCEDGLTAHDASSTQAYFWYHHASNECAMLPTCTEVAQGLMSMPASTLTAFVIPADKSQNSVHSMLVVRATHPHYWYMYAKGLICVKSIFRHELCYNASQHIDEAHITKCSFKHIKM